jgi:hypothetical protein
MNKINIENLTESETKFILGQIPEPPIFFIVAFSSHWQKKSWVLVDFGDKEYLERIKSFGIEKWIREKQPCAIAYKLFEVK